MGTSDTLLQTARNLLAEAGRPLNARRLLAMGQQRGAWPDGLDAAALSEALEDASGIHTLRRGVFAVGDVADAPRRTRPSKQAEPAEQEPPARGGDDRDRRKRRRTRSIDLVGDTPAAPLTVEDATRAARRGQSDRDGLRRKLWARIQREVAVAAGMDPAEASEPPLQVEQRPAAPKPAAPKPAAPAAAEQPSASAADPKSRLKDALRRRRRGDHPSEPEPPAAQAAPAPAEPAPESAAPAPVAAEAPRPAALPEAAPAEAYVEHRQGEGATHAPERRHPQLPELTASTALADAAEAALAQADTPLTVAALSKALASQGLAPAGLAGVLRADSAQRAGAGLRPRFTYAPDGSVALLAWGLTDHYRALEAQLLEVVAGLREAARRDLLARVGEVGAAGFARIIRLLLERQGLVGLETVHRAERSLALTGSRGSDGPRVVVVAHQSWSALGAKTVSAVCANLDAFGADEGLVITLGQVDANARAAADGARVEVWDGAAFAHALENQGVGLAEQRPVVRYPDHAFFAGLG